MEKSPVLTVQYTIYAPLYVAALSISVQYMPQLREDMLRWRVKLRIECPLPS